MSLLMGKGYSLQASKFKVLSLAKENFKFSAAHFLIFDEHRAERLHGHNYRVRLEVKLAWDNEPVQGYGIDFSTLKNALKAHLDSWDERVLLPGHHPELRVREEEGGHLQIHFRDRRYQFPAAEVILLPIVNTSVELLSGLLCEELWEGFKALGVEGFQIQVEETSGQSAKSSIGNW